MVLSRKTVLLLFMLAAAGAATGLALLRNPLYEGHLALEVQEANVDFLNLRAVDPTAPSGAFAPDSYVSTQARVLESRALVETVVDELKLADSPEFHRDKRLTNWLIAAGISADWAPWFRKLSPRERAVEAALESLHIKTTPGNRIVEITFDWPDPELAARFANLLASAFIAQTIEARWNSSQSTGEWLISQLETTRTRLESLEAELQAYSQSSGLLFTAEKDNVADERLRQIQAELSRAQADRAIRESSYKLSRVRLTRCRRCRIAPE
jgi:uncharacterized protein involved in exopolysaccharide biosynthesis